jgi:uncharacterized DUF497 family protein
MGSTFDPDKDGVNIAKHRLSLVEGEGVLNDPLGLTIEDESSEGEPRWITIGANASGELLIGAAQKPITAEQVRKIVREELTHTR